MVIFGFNRQTLLLFPLLILQETVYIYVQAKATAEVPEREIEMEPAQQCVWVTKEMTWHGSQGPAAAEESWLQAAGPEAEALPVTQ